MLVGCYLLLSVSTFLNAEEKIRVAVASNFSNTAKELAASYERQGGNLPTLLHGSTGKHVAQIIAGLDVDLLLAADSARPIFLEKKGLVTQQSRITYAIGRLVIWAPNRNLSRFKIQDLLLTTSKPIAIANPRLAPYGVAAQQVFDSISLDPLLAGKLVLGENISQAYQFVFTGHAEMGLVAQSQVLARDKQEVLIIPSELYSPIEQQMVLLSDSVQARDFYDFILSDKGMEIIRKHGYDIP